LSQLTFLVLQENNKALFRPEYGTVFEDIGPINPILNLIRSGLECKWKNLFSTVSNAHIKQFGNNIYIPRSGQHTVVQKRLYSLPDHSNFLPPPWKKDFAFVVCNTYQIEFMNFTIVCQETPL